MMPLSRTRFLINHQDEVFSAGYYDKLVQLAEKVEEGMLGTLRDGDYLVYHISMLGGVPPDIFVEWCGYAQPAHVVRLINDMDADIIADTPRVAVHVAAHYNVDDLLRRGFDLDREVRSIIKGLKENR